MLLPGKTGFLRGQGSKRIRCRKRRCTVYGAFLLPCDRGAATFFQPGQERCTVPGRTGGQGSRTGRTNVFCATDISDSARSADGREFCRNGVLCAALHGRDAKCLQNYCKICCSFHLASRFSMQSVEVYKLHSFSRQVYSFQQRRQFSRENKSNICAFFVWISAICVFLFGCCFVIIIVYNGGCAESPFKTMFSVF